MAKKKIVETFPDRFMEARERTEHFRRARTRRIREFVGRNWSDNGNAARMPLNYLELATGTYLQLLAARNPSVSVVARNDTMRSVAKDFELVIRKSFEDIGFEEQIQKLALEAMFSMGVMKVGITADWNKRPDLDVGQVFAASVSFDDLLLDTEAKCWEEQRFIGDRWGVPYEYAEDARLLGRNGSIVTYDNTTNETGEERASSLVSSRKAWTGDRGKFVEFWDVWFPDEGKVCTYRATADGIEKEPAWETEWKGPRGGMYHRLTFRDVPDSVVPMSPLSVIQDLNDMVNRMARKILNGADRFKSVLVVQGGADEHGRRVIEAKDGEAISTDRPEAAKEMRFGGVDNNLLAFLLTARDWTSYMAGNLDTLGGLSSMAGTLGQEEILTSAASGRVAAMQDRMISTIRSVVSDIAWWIWSDPSTVYDIRKPIGNSRFSIPVKFGPKDRVGDWLDYSFEIAPYSMQGRTPSERLGTLMSVLTTVLIPSMPMMQQQGMSLDWQAVMDQISRLTDMPEFREIVGSAPTSTVDQGQEPGPSKAPTSKRTYERKSGTPTRKRAERDMVSSLLKGSGERSE